MRAKEYAFAGKRLTKPAYGCLVVFTRQGGGHVGFVVGKDKAGNLLVLGGNQGKPRQHRGISDVPRGCVCMAVCRRCAS